MTKVVQGTQVGRPRLRSMLIIVGIAVFATGLAWADGTVSGTVSNSDGDPIEGVIVRVTGGEAEATTDDDGKYTLNLAPGNYRLLVIAQGYGSAGMDVTVEEGLVSDHSFQLIEVLSQFGEQVVVLGSRSERTALETPVPVDVLSSEELKESSQTETARKIQYLAPGFNISTSTVSDGSDIVRPSTLRGLAPDQTLVLVNGKRRHNSALVHVNGSIGRGSAGTDLNAIPASAIGNVEVLRDGAAAQYGSDAIAGVINLQLNRSTGKTHVDLTYGEYYKGDGTTSVASVTRGWKLGDKGGFINAAFEMRNRDWTNRAGQDPRQIFNFTEQVFGQPQLVDSDGDGICDSGGPCTPDPREQTYNRLNHRYGDAQSENLNLWVNSEIPLSNGFSFYFFGGWSDRDGESAGFNRLPGQSRTSIQLYPEGHLPLINTTVEDLSGSAGFKKHFGNWVMDASVTGGSNEFNFFISNSANTSLGTASPTAANAGTLNFGQTTVNLDFYTAFEAGNTPISIAVGTEYRQDSYEIEAGEDASWIDGGVPNQFGGVAPAGIQVFPGFRPTNEVDEDRNNVGVYGDVEFDFTDKFLLALAVRFEDYSDFGNNTSGKVAARYAFTKKFSLRGSVNSGFRAPSLQQSHFNNISTQFVDVNGTLTPLEVGTFRVEDPVAQALGAEPLKEETSVGGSFGFTSRPLQNLSITTDVFAIDIEDRIVLSGRFNASNPQIAPILAPFGVNSAQFFTNAIDTTTRGVDIVVAYRRALKGRGNGSLALTAALNFNKTELDGPVRTPDVLAGLGETLYDDIEVTYLERGQPRQHYNLGARWASGPWVATLRFNYFGSVQSTESASDPARKQTFSGRWITDLEVARNFGDVIRFALGANNIFDKFPDEQIASNSFNGIFRYPRRTAPFGFNGGYYYARLGFVF